MTELTISADEIRSAIEDYVSSYTPEADARKRSASSRRPMTASPSSKASRAR